MKREFSAGGAVHKAGLWLVIKPRPSKDFPSERFQLPKGHIEPDEKPTEAAVREVWEETGIKAKNLEKISDQKYVLTLRGEKIFKIVSFYLMEYVSGKPTENAEVEKIFWLPFEEAKKTLTYSSDKAVLQKAAEILEK